jgi:hypothetical protein
MFKERTWLATTFYVEKARKARVFCLCSQHAPRPVQGRTTPLPMPERGVLGGAPWWSPADEILVLRPRDRVPRPHFVLVESQSHAPLRWDNPAFLLLLAVQVEDAPDTTTTERPQYLRQHTA